MSSDLIIIFLIIVLIIILINTSQIEEKFTDTKKIAIALLTVQPNKIWLDFLLTFINDYDVYIFIDDNNFNITEFKNNYSNLNFIQIDNHEATINGYSNSSYIIKTDPISWDKALYYFTLVNKNYDNVWFIEDDVFIHSVKNILKLDNKYTKTDLIVKSNNINPDGKSSNWNHWNQVNNTLSLPWSMSMVCICRLSKELLIKINDFTKIHKKLNFIEFLFNTLAIHNNLTIDNPTEFEPVIFRKNWDIDHINVEQLYHPIKNINHHEYIRKNYN
jgi:hypothetical protein